MVSVGKTDRRGKGLEGRCSRIVTDQLGVFGQGSGGGTAVGRVCESRSLAAIRMTIGCSDGFASDIKEIRFLGGKAG